MYLIYLRRLIKKLISLVYGSGLATNSRFAYERVTGVGSQTITLKYLNQAQPLPDDNWDFVNAPFFIGDDGTVYELLGGLITNKTKSTFDINTATPGYLEYECRWLDENVRFDKVRITTSGDQIITLAINGKVAPYDDATWIFCNEVRSFLDDGTIVTPTITDRTNGDFTVNIGGAGYIIYKTRRGAAGENVRFKKVTLPAGTTNHVIVFEREGVVTVLGTSGTSWLFTGRPYVYDLLGTVIIPDIINRTKNGFTIVMSGSYFGSIAYLEYEAILRT